MGRWGGVACNTLRTCDWVCWVCLPLAHLPCSHPHPPFFLSQVANSEQLKRILTLVLAVSNYCNRGSFRGGLFGIQLESLVRLVETKGADKAYTILHYIVAQVRAAFPPPPPFVVVVWVCVCVRAW